MHPSLCNHNYKKDPIPLRYFKCIILKEICSRSEQVVAILASAIGLKRKRLLASGSTNISDTQSSLYLQLVQLNPF